MSGTIVHRMTAATLALVASAAAIGERSHNKNRERLAEGTTDGLARGAVVAAPSTPRAEGHSESNGDNYTTGNDEGAVVRFNDCDAGHWRHDTARCRLASLREGGEAHDRSERLSLLRRDRSLACRWRTRGRDARVQRALDGGDHVRGMERLGVQDNGTR